MYSDISNQRFGHLVVIERDTSFRSPKHTKWICKCDCGNTKSIFRYALITGKTKSCGCQMYKGKKGVNSTHGLSGTRIHHEWMSMRRRCKPNTIDSKTYYDRGITVCDEWEHDFMSFYNWAMSNGYNDNLSIDRINNNLGYYPENCRWVPIEDQQGNKSNTVHINYKGTDYCLRSLCTMINFPYKLAHRRYRTMVKKGLPIDVDKLFAPSNSSRIPLRYR